MARRNIYQWCKRNNWTEPRQLANGIWVAFPPGGVIETPLPAFSRSPVSTSTRIQDVIYSLILFLAALAVGTIALIMSPLFLAKIVDRYRKNQSMS